MNSTRRDFLAGAAVGGLSLGIASTTGDLAYSADRNTAREQAVHRRRRIIFNNDGDDIWAPGADSKERFLASRHTPLIGTHVDSIHYCTTQSFNFFTHQTKVAEVFTSQGGQFANNNLAKFLEQDTDGLRMSTEFAHEHGMESIWTLRMNDIHDAWTPQFRPKWKQEDPTRIMSTLEESKKFEDRRKLWSLVDFEHSDVQPRLLEIIAEVLSNYDVEGVELDFLRAPFYFRSTYHGEAATASQIEVLTKLVRAIRQLVLRESKRQNKPLLLAVRVPSTPALCEKIGIDVRSWLQEKLIDVVTLGGGYITFDVQVRELIDLAHDHGVPAYPCLSQSGLMYRPPRGTSTKQPPQAWFGAASRLWQDGADGIYTFNLFPGPGNHADRKYARQILSAIGSRERLAGSSIMYAVSDAGWWMPAHFWSKDVADFSRALPLPLRANEYERTSLYVPEDLRGAGFDVTAELRVDFTGLTAESTPEILFGSANFGPTANGKNIGDVRRYFCNVPVQSISQGANRVMVKSQESDAQLAGAELWIQR